MMESYEWTTNKLPPQLVDRNWDYMNYAIAILVGVMQIVGIDDYSQNYRGYELSIKKTEGLK